MRLTYNSRGPEVYKLQVALRKKLQLKLHPDGIFNAETEEAVKQYQRLNFVTGVVDEDLYTKIINDSVTESKQLSAGEFVPTEKKASREGNKPDTVIIFYTNTENLDEALYHLIEDNLKDNPYSAHFVIDLNGHIIQTIGTNEASFVYGRIPYKDPGINQTSISIALVNVGTITKKGRQYVFAKDRDYDAQIYGVPYRDNDKLWMRPSSEQVKAVVELLKELHLMYPSIKEVTTEGDMPESPASLTSDIIGLLKEELDGK